MIDAWIIWYKIDKNSLINLFKNDFIAEKFKTKPGPIPKVKIVTEKFMNKNITRILGLETYEIDFKDVWKVLQNKLAVGVSICKSEKSYSFEHIKVQGLHPDRIEAILIDDFCIPRKYVDTLKAKKNKNKNK